MGKWSLKLHTRERKLEREKEIRDGFVFLGFWCGGSKSEVGGQHHHERNLVTLTNFEKGSSRARLSTCGPAEMPDVDYTRPLEVW